MTLLQLLVTSLPFTTLYYHLPNFFNPLVHHPTHILLDLSPVMSPPNNFFISTKCPSYQLHTLPLPLHLHLHTLQHTPLTLPSIIRNSFNHQATSIGSKCATPIILGVMLSAYSIFNISNSSSNNDINSATKDVCLCAREEEESRENLECKTLCYTSIKRDQNIVKDYKDHFHAFLFLILKT